MVFRRPIVPSNFKTKVDATLDDFRRFRVYLEELIQYIDGQPAGGISQAAADARYLLRSAGDFATFANKPTIAAADVFLIEDSAAAGVKKYVSYSALDPWARGSKPLFIPPATAGTLDDEFEGSSLNAAWGFYDATADVNRTPSGTVDPFTVLTGATTVPRVTVGQRASHVKFQTTDSGVFYFMHKAVTLPTNCFVWARLASSGNANGPSRIQLFVSPDNAGRPDVTQTGSATANMLAVGPDFNSGGALSVALSTISGGGAVANTTFVDKGTDYHYAGFMKVGTTFHPLVFSDDGRYFAFTSQTATWTIGRIGFRVVSTAGGFGAPVHDVDFVREDTPWRF